MKTKILYVDDEPINLQLFKINFDKKYEVFVADDGFQGLELLNNELDILVVISDMKMPKMNGVEFIKKAKEQFPDKKFYILTGYEINSEIQDALNSGLILRYFSKPFNIKEIEKTISDAISL
ncbi:MAG: response regulator [Bacteroidales bacterium]|nr:response regulator [Bacteroidales bacterium]